jgi:hypothetical protein
MDVPIVRLNTPLDRQKIHDQEYIKNWIPCIIKDSTKAFESYNYGINAYLVYFSRLGEIIGKK